MVGLDQMRASNAQIATTYPEGLVAVFAGATAGIGETSLREFARCTPKPRIYIIGRSKEACDRLETDLKAVNPTGQYIFLRTDLSLLRNVDDVCREIQSKEPAINLLFMSQGTMNITKKTEEGLSYLLALTFFGRLRMATNLLPQLHRANKLRRVVSSFAGTKDGAIQADDWDHHTGSKGTLSLSKARGHGAAMMTLALVNLDAKTNNSTAAGADKKEVSFVHNYPGLVNTGLIRGDEGFAMQVLKYVLRVVGWVAAIPIREVGERHVFFCTAERFAPGAAVARGFDGRRRRRREGGGGVYNIDEKGESARPKVEELLRGYVEDGMADRLGKFVDDVFERITGSNSI